MQIQASLASLSLGLLVVSPATSAVEHEWRTLDRAGAHAVRYAVVLPAEFDASRAHPVLLALPRGAQDEAAVESTLEILGAAEAARAGWIVACPVAPQGELFFHGAEDALVPLLDELAKTFEVESGRVHVAGISNGGRSAFRLAALAPGRIASLIACPGYPSTQSDFDALGALTEVPIALFAGGADGEWVEAMKRTESRLRELGAREITLTVFEGEGHVPPSFTATRCVALLERFRADERARAQAELEVAELLDGFHRAASKADLEHYFAALAPDAIYVGTDASERWTVAQFRAYVEPYFRRGQGWTYTPSERHVSLSSSRDVAWFDERLTNAKYGEVRGSGVVRRRGKEWRIAQYVLSFAVPNAVAGEVVERIRAAGGGR